MAPTGRKRKASRKSHWVGIAMNRAGRLFFYESSAFRDAGTWEGEGDPQASKTPYAASQETCQPMRAISPDLGREFPAACTEVVMAVSTTSSVTLSANDRLVAGVFALLLGAFLVFGAGLANSAVLHDTAHDARHSYGFPCH